MRPIWTGAISFGLINIPVKLFSAVQESTLDLDMLDSRDHANIQFKRVNAESGKEVPFKNIVKGYLYKNKYVVLEKSDFESADAKKTKMIEIINFVNQAEIDPMYYEQPYYLEPDKYGAKAYGILRDALAASGRAAIATFVMRNKESLAVLSARGAAIVLNRIRFEEEIRSTKGLDLPAVSKTKSKSKELGIALQLIEQQTDKFDIGSYKDTYSGKLLKIIAQKAKHPGKKVKAPVLKVSHKQEEGDLMSMLKASLGGKRKAS